MDLFGFEIVLFEFGEVEGVGVGVMGFENLGVFFSFVFAGLLGLEEFEEAGFGREEVGEFVGGGDVGGVAARGGGGMGMGL